MVAESKKLANVIKIIYCRGHMCEGEVGGICPFQCFTNDYGVSCDGIIQTDYETYMGYVSRDKRLFDSHETREHIQRLIEINERLN